MKEMIQARKEQLQERGVKGFTLMEMLIVIAIIAVLVAIAIPVFTAQLNNAKDAADQANGRSIYAVASADYLTNNVVDTGTFTDHVYTITLKDSTTQSFTFSDRTTGVDIKAGTNGAPVVTVTSKDSSFVFPKA